MDLFISFGLLVVGLIIGFFTARFIYVEKSAKSASKKSATEVKMAMTQQAEHHIFQTKQTLNTLQQHIETLTEQVLDYENQIQPKEDDSNVPKMSFFGEQATTLLRNTQKLQKRDKKHPDEQPRDFSNARSGLFVGEKPSSDAPK